MHFFTTSLLLLCPFVLVDVNLLKRVVTPYCHLFILKLSTVVLANVNIVSACVCELSIDYLLRNGSWQCVEQQGEEQHCDEHEQGSDDVLLVASPHQVEETFEWIDKPREGGVWTTGGRG